ncbi:TAXI family TRAP transporter solute-binding subunit [Falsirhodobacter xinxiangensis]|uniref:TAXI family TRAP transporter solute-binding subunit n=1 Tax=Falsirhodobacter xinxiangensis TaxID=2530049 RepID=UPI00145A540B|nr:TAXI family TRAP transporter solute-binding subunit [Rhodobacter xinxiangensis]
MYMKGAAFALVLAAAPASAQMVGLATTTGGATEQLAMHLAKVLSQETDLVIRPQVMANTSQYIPLVNQGRIEFGIANFPQVSHAMDGIGMSEGSANPDLRMVATMLPFNAGLVVPADSGIETLADLAGRKVPQFPPNSLGAFFFTASMETAGVSYDDVQGVPTSNFGQQFNNVKEGMTEVTIGSVGAQSIMDVEASVGEVRYLTFKEGDEEILSKYLPGTSLKTWGDRPDAAGISPETMVLFYDYTLFAHKDVPDEMVTQVLEALYSNPEAMKTGGAMWNEYDPAQLARVTVLPFHPAAESFFKDKGIWPAN